MKELYRLGLIFIGIIIISIVIYQFRPTRVPRIIWSYWDKDVPKSVEQIVANNRKQLVGWDYRFCTAETLSQYIDPTTFPNQYTKLSAPHQADYIRLALLQRYGGVWLDSSIIINSVDELNRMCREVEATRSELGVFTLGEPEETYVENWFIMAPKQSPIIDQWLQEYDTAVRKGFHQYKRDVFTKNIHINERIYKKDDNEVYLTQHACLQVVLQTKIPSHARRICMYKSEHSMFKLHIDCDWKTECIKDKLKKEPERIRRLPFIKLRGKDRGEDLSEYFRVS
jgi:hypothetical protein